MAYSSTRATVITPSVTRSTPSISAVGGRSDPSKFRLGRRGLRRNLAAMVEVVPPQMMCLPSLEKNRLIIRSQSSRLEGGPNSMFMGSRLRMRTTAEVTSSLGSPPYSL